MVNALSENAARVLIVKRRERGASRAHFPPLFSSIRGAKLRVLDLRVQLCASRYYACNNKCGSYREGCTTCTMLLRTA